MRVNEIFRSIQGESVFAGLPCVFVRLSGCNLRCRYCDTPYAQDAGGGVDMAEDAVAERVKAFATELVTVTGGEPLLQAEVPVLIRDLVSGGHTVLVETNGSVPLPDLPGCSVVMDIKCPSSGHSDAFHPPNARRLKPGDQVKFVVADRADFDWALSCAKREGFFAEGRGLAVLMSPVAGECDPAELANWILASGLPFRLQLQLHKVVWPGADRGV